MTKADLVEKVTRLGDLTRRDGEIIVETIFDSVIRALQGGDKIEIRGFGSFRIRQRNPRIGRNPKTGERVEVPAKRVPYFKPSKAARSLNPEEAAKPSGPSALPAGVAVGRGDTRFLRTSLCRPFCFPAASRGRHTIIARRRLGSVSLP
jgi:integration host factor subunit beta